MHVQIINFQLKEIGDKEYAGLAGQVASSFAKVPGLLSKVWLANTTTGTYGGVYFWSSRQAMEDFAGTDLFKSVATHPNLKNITSTDFAVMDEPSKVTRGFLVAG